MRKIYEHDDTPAKTMVLCVCKINAGSVERTKNAPSSSEGGSNTVNEVHLVILCYDMLKFVWCGVVRCGVVWCGVVWCGADWFVLHTSDVETTSLIL